MELRLKGLVVRPHLPVFGRRDESGILMFAGVLGACEHARRESSKLLHGSMGTVCVPVVCADMLTSQCTFVLS
jgi:hypothetical protein